MKKIFFYFFFIQLIACTEKYTEYKPHFFDNDNKHFGEPELDSLELKNVIQVLHFYNIDYKIKNNNTILISEELNNDWELMWNITSKSKDNEWLKTHTKNSKADN